MYTGLSTTGHQRRVSWPRAEVQTHCFNTQTDSPFSHTHTNTLSLTHTPYHVHVNSLKIVFLNCLSLCSHFVYLMYELILGGAGLLNTGFLLKEKPLPIMSNVKS